MKAGLVRKMEEDWDYSSFKDYAGLHNGSLCNKKVEFQLLDINPATFYQDSYAVINDERIRKIF